MSLLENSGNLEEMSLPDLLATICGRQETGVLRLTRHGVTKSIYIQEGRLVFATSTDPDDRLGELLLEKGLLKIQHFEEASARLTQRKRLGAVLVEMGSLRAEELVRTVVEQVKQIVFDLFLWFDGEYSFARGELPSREVITLKLSTPEVILGGIQRIDRWSRVLRGVGGLDAVLQSSGGRDRVLQQMQLRGEHAALLQTLEQPMSVRDLCRKGLLSDFEVCRTLWAFRVIGLVEPTSPAAQARPLAAEAEPPLEAGLFPEDEPGANAMTMMMPAVPPRSAKSAPASSASAPPRPAASRSGPAAAPQAAPAAPRAGRPPAAEVSEEEPALEIVEVDGGAAEPSGEASQELDEQKIETALAAFNDKHRRLQALLQEKAKPKAAEVVRRSLATIEQDLPGLFNGMEPGPDGSFDVDALKMNIFAFGVVGYAAGLDMLIEREIETAGSLLGPEVRRHIASGLKTVHA